jgi:hypothetical protein
VWLVDEETPDMTTSPDLLDDTPLTDAEVADVLGDPLPGMPEVPASTPEPGDLLAPRPGAPYGVTTRGKPRKRPAGKRATTPRKRPAGKTSTAAASTAPPVDYAAGARSLVATLGMLLGLAGRAKGDQALQLDAMTLQVHREPLTTGLADAAVQVPLVATVLTWFATTSPYAAMAESIAKVGAQVAANHGMVAPGTFGAVDAGTLQVQAARQTIADMEAADLPVPDELRTFAQLAS